MGRKRSLAANGAARRDRGACLLSSAQIQRRRSRAVHIVLAIAAVLLVLEIGGVSAPCLQQWSSWLLALAFPSQDVTCAKVGVLAVGFALSFYHLVLADRCRRRGRAALHQHSAVTRGKAHSAAASIHDRTSSLEARGATLANPTTGRNTSRGMRGPKPLEVAIEPELPQIKLVNEGQSSGISSGDQRIHINGKEPIAFENDLFKGRLLFLVRDSTAVSVSGVASGDSNSNRSNHNRSRRESKTNWSHLFNGRKRTLWVQVQGHFKRAVPPDSMLFLAAEVVSPLTLGFWTRKLVEVLVAIMKKITRSVHVAFGDESEDDELPHAAFPLYECVDEFVETPAGETLSSSPPSESSRQIPTLGVENFGESPQQKEQRMRRQSSGGSSSSSGRSAKQFAPGKVYTFQFYTMYADLAQWQISNLPGMPEIPLSKLVGEQPIRLAAYMVAAPSPLSPSSTADIRQPKHVSAAKDYLFCFSVCYSEENLAMHRRLSGANCHSLTPSLSRALSSSTNRVESPPPALCSPTASSLRSTLMLPQESPAASDEDAHANPMRASLLEPLSPTLSPKLQQHEQALSSLKFALPMWIELVDRVAGNRKVSYLFTVEEQLDDSRAGIHRYCVVRSAATIKSTLVLLRDDDPDSRDARQRSASTNELGASRSLEEEFRKLLLESREFLYETISSETSALAGALQKIAASPASSSQAAPPSRLEQLKKAMLYHCLKSFGVLPSVRAPQDIGIQLTKAKRERMDIIWECGVYRAHTSRMLRQEWLMLTTSDVLFFRSYSMRPCKSLPITELLRVQVVDGTHVLNPNGGTEKMTSASESQDTSQQHDATNSSPDWHCVELHLVREIVTVFLDSRAARRQFVASLNQIVLLRAKPGCLSPPLSFEHQPLPLCLNRRNVLTGIAVPTLMTAATPLSLVQSALQKGLAIFEMRTCDRKPGDLLPFLDAVELLADMELPGGDEAVTSTGVAAGVAASPMHNHSGVTRVGTSTIQPPLSHEEKLAFALNLYHVLFIHASLVFAPPVTHFHWKKLQSVPFYLIGAAPHKQMRVTLETIENEVLRASSATPSSSSPLESMLKSPEKGGSARRLLQLGRSSGSLGTASDTSVPRHLAITCPDFRTTFALQMNCSPGTHVMCVYEGSPLIHEQLNATCKLFLAHELRVDVSERVVWLPRVVEWRQQDFLPRSTKSYGSGSTVAAMTTGICANSDARAFFCLQKLLGFLADTQREQAENVLLGAGRSARIVYDSFWTQSSSSGSGSGGGKPRSASASVDPDRRTMLASPTRSASARDAPTLATAGGGASVPSAPAPPNTGSSTRQFFQSLFSSTSSE